VTQDAGHRLRLVGVLGVEGSETSEPFPPPSSSYRGEGGFISHVRTSANDQIRNWQAVRRVEDRRFLTGQGRYVDDIILPGMCHGVSVLSPHAHAHARIKNVDTSKADGQA
jgi:hypothetical protein